MSADVAASLEIGINRLGSSETKLTKETNVKKSQTIRTTDTLKVKAIATLKAKVVVLLVAASLILGYGNGSSPSA